MPKFRPFISCSVAVVALSALLALGLSACSGGDDSDESGASTPSSETLRVFSFSQLKPGHEAIAAAFEKQHPGADVEMTYFVSYPDYANALQTQLAAGGGPDVIYTVPGAGLANSTLALAEQGSLAPLSAPWTEDVDERLLAGVEIDGKVYGYPLDVSYSGLIYSSDKLTSLKLEPPAAFKDLIADCRASQGTPLIAGTMNQASGAGGVMNALGAAFVLSVQPDWFERREAGETTFASSSEWHTMFQRLLDMEQAGCFQARPEATERADTWAMLAQQKAAMLIEGSAAIAAVQGLEPSIKLSFAPFPADDAADTVWPASATNGLSVSATSPNQELAQEFINFSAEEAQADAWAEHNNTITPGQFTEAELPASLSQVEPLLKAGKVVPQVVSLLPDPAVSTALIQGVEGLFTGQKTIDDVLKDMDSTWENAPA